MKPDILLLRERHRIHSPLFVRSLKEHFTVHEMPATGDKEAFVAGVTERVRALVTTTVAGADADLINALPRLEIIVCSGGHPDRIDHAAARARGIPVTDTPHVSADDVADLPVTLLLSVARRTCEGDRFIRAGEWLKGSLGLATRVTGKRAGIVGLGYIGRRVAKRLDQGFGMDVGYHEPNEMVDAPYRYHAELLTLARDSDFLVLLCATLPETRHMVGREVLEALGPRGYLIVIARGVVDEAALTEALADGTIAGAGIDVFDGEPRVPEALLAMDNVVLTPHVGGMTEETKQGQVDLTVGNLLAHFDGRPLLTPVT
jgi:hydroxypyruvate reductase 2